MPRNRLLPKILIVLCSTLFLLGGCSPTTRLVAGNLKGEVLWDGTVYVGGDVILAPGATLRIAPGTEVVFLPATAALDRFRAHPHFPGSELIIRGRILAEGRADAPIRFRYVDPGSGPGSWGGLNLMESPEARFRYCLFAQADSALHSQGSVVSVEESVLERNRVAIRFHSSDMRLENNLLRNNGVAIRFHYGAPLIRGNDFDHNGKAFFLTAYPRNYRIEHNNIVGSAAYSVVLGEEVPGDIAMTGNYWGSVEPARIEAGFFDGRREGHLGQVEYRPFAESPFAGNGPSWTP